MANNQEQPEGYGRARGRARGSAQPVVNALPQQPPQQQPQQQPQQAAAGVSGVSGPSGRGRARGRARPPQQQPPQAGIANEHNNDVVFNLGEVRQALHEIPADEQQPQRPQRPQPPQPPEPQAGIAADDHIVMDGAYLIERIFQTETTNKALYNHWIATNVSHTRDRFLRRDLMYQKRITFSYSRSKRQGVQESYVGFPVYYSRLGRALYFRCDPNVFDGRQERFFQNAGISGFHIYFYFDILVDHNIQTQLSASLVYENATRLKSSTTINETIPTYNGGKKEILVARRFTKDIYGYRYTSRFGDWRNFGGVYDVYHKSINNYRWTQNTSQQSIGIYLNENVRLVMTEELPEMPVSSSTVIKKYSPDTRNCYNKFRRDSRTGFVHHTRTLYLGGTFIVLSSSVQRIRIAYAKYLFSKSHSMPDFIQTYPQFFSFLPANRKTNYIIRLNAVTPDPYSSLCYGLMDFTPIAEMHCSPNEKFVLVIPDGDIAPTIMVEFNQNIINRITRLQETPLTTTTAVSDSPINTYMEFVHRGPITLNYENLHFGLITPDLIGIAKRHHNYAFIHSLLFRRDGYEKVNTNGRNTRCPIYKSVMMAYNDYVRRVCLPEMFRDYRDPNGESVDELDGVRYLVYNRSNNRTEYVPVFALRGHEEDIVENVFR